MIRAVGTAARAVVFDLDGTLVDSEPLHERAARDTLRDFGIDPPAGAFDEFIGQRVDELTSQLAARYGVPADRLLAGRERRFTALLPTLGLMPGAAACLDRLRAQGAVLALATSATRSYLDYVLDRFGWRETFAAVVCGDDVTAGKPDPQTYLRVADRLGRPATDCLVVEDSPRGCAAGLAAGMDVVVVDHARRPAAAYPGARWIVPDLDSAGDLLGAESADDHRPQVAAVVLAGGSGTRFGLGSNKVYLPLAGVHLLTWSLRAMAALPGLARMVLVIRDADRDAAGRVLGTEALPVAVDLVVGGESRHESEYQALQYLSAGIHAGEIDVVVTHDGARPLPSPRLVRAVVDAVAPGGGAVPGIPARDLVEVEGDGTVRRLLDTDHVRVQTPQAFAAAPLLAAYDAAAADGFTGTDTSACVQRYAGAAIRWVTGEADNIKVTLPTDLAAAEAIIRRRSGRR